jgi:hypothetical protein
VDRCGVETVIEAEDRHKERVIKGKASRSEGKRSGRTGPGGRRSAGWGRPGVGAASYERALGLISGSGGPSGPHRALARLPRGLESAYQSYRR